MYLLWMFGARVERTFSSRMFLFFYLVCGIVGCLLSLLMRSFGSPDIPSLGASGAVFGVLVGYGFLFANETILLLFAIPVKVWKAVVGFIALETLFILFQMQAGTDNWAHLGGAMASAVWMLVLVRRTGNKTAHGWHHSGRRQQGGQRMNVILFPGQKKPKTGFWIFKQRKKTGTDEHPEGTDDEPPPDWFKL
jgi:membrane associated rhomboid family serine protease